MSPPGGVLKHGLRSTPSDRIWRCSVPALHDAFTRRQSFSIVFVTILDLQIHSVWMVVFLRRAFPFVAVHVIVYIVFRVRGLDRARFLSSNLGVVCIRCILFFRYHAFVRFGLGFFVFFFFFLSFHLTVLSIDAVCRTLAWRGSDLDLVVGWDWVWCLVGGVCWVVIRWVSFPCRTRVSFLLGSR